MIVKLDIIVYISIASNVGPMLKTPIYIIKGDAICSNHHSITCEIKMCGRVAIKKY
jgi:hypothetical protein